MIENIWSQLPKRIAGWPEAHIAVEQLLSEAECIYGVRSKYPQCYAQWREKYLLSDPADQEGVHKQGQQGCRLHIGLV